jgi:hypothetical protein
LCEPFDDRGLADAGLADQHGIVLGPALQHLDRAPDFLVAPDHRIELALLGAFGHVDGVLRQRLARVLGVRIGHVLAAAQARDRALERRLLEPGFLQQAAEFALIAEGGDEEQFAREIGVALLLRELVGEIQQAHEVVRRMHVATGAFDFRQAIERLAHLAAQGLGVDAAVPDQMFDRAAVLFEQGGHQVQRFDELVIEAQRPALGVAQGLLESGCHFVRAHGVSFGV